MRPEARAGPLHELWARIRNYDKAHEPLNLGEVARLLAAERDHCYAAFEAFQALMAEHEAVIDRSS
jgi:hypothetical protein